MAHGTRSSRLFLLLLASPFCGGEAFALSRTLHLGHLGREQPGFVGGGGGSSGRGDARRGPPAGWTRSVVEMNAADTAADLVSGATETTSRAQEEFSSLAGSESGEEGGLSGLESEGKPGERRSKRRGRSRTSLGPRVLGDVEEQGSSGTRVGYQVQRVYEVPEQAPTNLPEGEDEGYPMLIYQFMHAQYRDDFPSQSSARKSVRRKELLLNGAEVKNDVKVKPGDTVTMQKRAQPGLFPQGKPSCTLPVLWEDDFMAVIVKPQGVAVQGGTGKDDPGPGGRRSVRQALPYILKPTRSEDRPLHRPMHCHRLDKATGGLMICAKTRPALIALCDAFEKRLVSKRYVALVAGELEGSGSIATPLDGKASHTNYRVRGTPVRSLETSFITTVDLWPHTGRFHQLRRHLSSIGCPILGDRRYTPGEVPFQEGGMYLQAVGLTFPHPITGEEMNFSIPEPAKFEKWRQKEHQRWLQLNENIEEAPSGVEGPQDGREKSVNAVPEVEGLQVEERDGFRYYQYDWSAVGGKPTALSTEDIDSALDGAP